MPDPQNPLDLSAYDISPVTGLALMIFPFAIGLFTLFLLIKPIHERTVVSLLTGAARFRWKRFFWGTGAWLLLMCAYMGISIASGMQKVEFQFQPEYFLPLILVSVFLLPLQTGFEEIFFRGYLLQGFGNIFLNRWAPLLITALIFGGLHYFNPEVKAFGLAVAMPQYIWFGILFGLCTILDDGLELAWGAHTINNIFLSVFFTQESSAIQTPALFSITEYNPVIDLGGLIVLSLIFLHLAGRRFQWPGLSFLFARIEKPAKTDEAADFDNYALYDDYEDDNDEK